MEESKGAKQQRHRFGAWRCAPSRRYRVPRAGRARQAPNQALHSVCNGRLAHQIGLSLPNASPDKPAQDQASLLPKRPDTLASAGCNGPPSMEGLHPMIGVNVIEE